MYTRLRKQGTFNLDTIDSKLEKCKTLRGEPELIMSCTHDSLKFLGAKWNLLNDSCMIDEVTAAACMHNIALYISCHDQ